MQDLNTISSSQYANAQATAINQNFSALKSAVESIDGGGSGGDETRTYENNFSYTYAYVPALKVLAIGNSFLSYPLSAFQNVIDLSEVATSKYTMQIEGSTGTPLSQVLSAIRNNNQLPAVHRIFGGAGSVNSSNWRTDLIYDWDYIIFQQNSDNAADYTTYRPYLDAVVEAARRYSTNHRVKIGWQMIWDKRHGFNDTMRENILLNSKKVMDDCGIDFVIPSGTAVENAWANNLPIDYQLTGWPKGLDTSGHPKKILQYVVAATWYQTLYNQFVGKDIVADMAPSAIQSWTDPSGTTTNAEINDCILAAKCAKAAVEDMWNITTNIS